MLKKLTPSFSLTFDTPIWKIEASSSANRLFLELRDADQHQVRFAAIDLLSGQLLWSDFTLPEPWWVTLASASDDYLLLQSFTDTHNPEKKTYFAIDANTRKLLWQSSNFQIIRLEKSQLIGYNTEDESRTLMQIELPGGGMEKYPAQKMPDRKNKDFLQPFFYSENQPYFTTVANFVESLELPRPVGSCEYLEYGAYICIAYYVANEDSELANYLLIIDQDGTILLHECLEVSVPNVGLGTFFIAQDQLIVVQHKLQLVSYALS
uniref:DUF4905 domain-containing protein n=1 Tax=Roseihalotalea indica TaxID=2867963 RepID=A0AA49GPB5_9BACT|nr:DUF4905 domain-containing protein [Tunicatimonas sp. TK19036]